MKVANPIKIKVVVWVLLMQMYCALSINAQTTSHEPLFPCSAKLDNQYGITSHITWHGYDYDNCQKNISSMATMGSNVVRLDFNSPGIGWESGNINYSIWDNVYYKSKGNGLKLLPIVYKPRYKIYTKEYGDSYKALLKSCLEKYGDNVEGWEIWNEMDQMNAEDGTAPPKEYLPLLKDAYRAIKSQNNDNVVLMGAIGDLRKNYFDELLQMKVADYFDVLSIHYYSGKLTPEDIVSFYKRLKGILNHYKVSKPVWLTETGYVSVSDNTDADLFYTKVLPQAYKQLGINSSKSTIGILYDKRMTKGVWNQDNPNIAYGFKSCQLVAMDYLKHLSVENIPVLMILFGEKFPKGYFEDLRGYVERGGTIVFPEGGALLYYEWDLDTDEITGVGTKYYQQLHVGCMFSWAEEAKRLGVTEMKSVRVSPWMTSNYTWTNDDMTGPKYLTNENLKEDDEMITLLEGTDGKNRGPVAACYKLNSDLKGNVIIQTRPKLSDRVSESHQASRYPRLYLLSYALGVDKVFAYCLTDRKDAYGYGVLHKDLTPKPLVYTLQTLSRMLPSGSTRPTVTMQNNEYIASWSKPNGEIVHCVWSSLIGQSSNIEVKGRARFYNSKGDCISKSSFAVTPDVTYITSAKSVSFKSRH